MFENNIFLLAVRVIIGSEFLNRAGLNNKTRQQLINMLNHIQSMKREASRNIHSRILFSTFFVDLLEGV